MTANRPAGKSASGAPRRGSILSIWSTGKDKFGKSALVHDDHEDGEAVDVMSEEEKEEGDPALLHALGRDRKNSNAGSDKMGNDRRGSILSLWTGGKDENGRAIMMHDDEAERDIERHSSPIQPKQKIIPITSYIAV